MCFVSLSSESPKLKTNWKFEYTNQILDGFKIELPYIANHIHMQIIKPRACLCYMIIVYIWCKV